MRNWSALLAFVATIMLVIAGGPSVATAAACDPCPPDCPMMAPAQTSATAMDDHAKAPAKGEAPQKSSCVQAGLCQATTVAPPLAAATVAVLHLPQGAARHDIVSDRTAPSRPPDRELRPPIFL
ncbi:MAG: hypothetical protein GC203_00055 [Phenylobacterium sp.]|uniref:hypothetical protein n=1 Tax=Phenylobacterium sp. TaxID=1871053 RepID=UPI0025E6391A|nr:hypothetical protein [Phenylobacterium sp.]MBI1196235.1 hypothetical protein [Phenylobacterium sp.]